jgi:hypothetical protein
MMTSKTNCAPAEPRAGDGSAVEIAPGVIWLRMPLFASLPWINVWAIADSGGWTIVDTGLRSAKTLNAWHSVFSGILGGARVTRVIATHMHPDHCGMAYRPIKTANLCAATFLDRCRSGRHRLPRDMAVHSLHRIGTGGQCPISIS